MSSLATSVVETVGDLFGGSPALETPEPEPEPEPEPAEALTLAPAAEVEDLLWDDEPAELADTAEIDSLDEDEVRARLVRAQREVEHERKLRVASGQKAWRAEAEQKFPYSKPGQIEATSRREFLRQAQARDQEFRSQAQPLLDKFKAREATMRTQIEAEVRKEFETAWGRPTLGSGPAAPANAGAEDKLKTARGRRDLKGVAAALMDTGRI